eukprot:TRINITY_DN10887_c0_g4_i1.p1 TRINITY_DN10887_c0_g4~~TRINITY_DN10887_c0_g4_i1.p1  ORF type:complete len:496 (+),score=116.40 TRINITY_DN10887_c0_g4_i1:105-1592(+)
MKAGGSGKGTFKGKGVVKGKSKTSRKPRAEDASLPDHGNIFVLDLPYGMAEKPLLQLFDAYGLILSTKMNVEKRWALIRYETPEQAKAAIDEVNGLDVGAGPHGRLKVRFANQDKGERNADGGVMEADEGSSTGVPGSTVFVYYLPMAWSDHDLRKHFKHCGKIARCGAMRTNEGISRGFGYVIFTTIGAAALAVTALDGFTTDDSKALAVRPKTDEQHLVPLPELAFVAPGSLHEPVTGAASPPGATAFLFHIPPHWDETVLIRHFIHCGPIMNARIMRKADGESRGFGFVGFENPRSAEKAVAAMNGFGVDGGKFLKVDIKQGKEGTMDAEHQAQAPPLSAGHPPPKAGLPKAGPPKAAPRAAVNPARTPKAGHVPKKVPAKVPPLVKRPATGNPLATPAAAAPQAALVELEESVMPAEAAVQNTSSWSKEAGNAWAEEAATGWPTETVSRWPGEPAAWEDSSIAHQSKYQVHRPAPPVAKSAPVRIPPRWPK